MTTPVEAVKPLTVEDFDRLATTTNCFAEMREAMREEREKDTLDPVASRAQNDWGILANEVVGHER